MTMKKTTTLFITLLGSALTLNAQNQKEEMEVKVTYDQCESFTKTAPLRDLLKTLTPIDEATYYDSFVAKDRKYQQDWSTVNDHGIPSNNGMDPVAQTTNGSRDGGNWQKANWQALSGAFPPDPSGAAGPDHYVQAVNSSYRVYNKDGSAASSPAALGSLWSSTSDGDPIVMYDRFADRWFISQFKTSNNGILIAISETADPLGAYFLYTFTFPSFPDYPKFGVWSNAYYMTSNMGSNDCVAFDRDKMLLGDASAGKINMSFPYFYQFFNSVAPAYAEGPTLPEADEPGYFFAVQDDSWSGVSTDHIKVLKATLDWDVPSNSSVVIHQSVNTAAFNGIFTGSWDDITQQGTTQKLDAVAGIFMYRAQYRRFDDYNVVMLCHTVDVDNTNRAGVRWYELRDNNDGNWFIHQQGTYSPDSQNSRWMGSIAMDKQGNIALAYSFAGPNNYAGIRYTGRYKNDPLGQMTVQEQIGIAGSGFQTGGNRYGDYAQMTMDPADDMTFWYTGEYLGSGGTRRTRILSFSSWHLLEEEENVELVPFFNAYQPQSETIRVVWADIADQQVTATITDMQGKLIANRAINTADTQMDFDISNVAGGIYFVTLTGEKTKLSKKIYIAK